MGVPDFFRVVISKISDRNNKLPGKIDVLAIDLNASFYRISEKIRQVRLARQASEAALSGIQQEPKPLILDESFYDEFIDNLTHELNGLIETAMRSGCKVLIIAIDGLAPMPKIQHQRDRRLRGVSVEIESGDTTVMYTKTQEEMGMLFTGNVFTPGTEFMDRIGNAINKWLRLGRDHLPDIIYFSDSFQPGEGEHKIYDIISERCRSGDNIVIVSPDADLVFLSMLRPEYRFFIYTNYLVLRKNGIGLGRDNLPTQPVYETPIITYVDQVLDYLAKHAVEPESYAFACMMFGNDFLPPIIGFSLAMDNCYDVFFEKIKRRQLIQEGRILPDRVAEFLQSFIQESFISGLSQTQFQFPFKLYQGSWEQFKTSWYNRAYPGATEEEAKELVDTYLRAWAWVWSYYRHGQRSVDWSFTYPWRYAPLIEDMIPIISVLSDPQKPMAYRLTSTIQMLAVMPASNIDIVPKNYQRYFQPGSIIDDLHPTRFRVIREGVDKDFKGHIDLPALNYKRLLNIQNYLGIEQTTESTYQIVYGNPVLMNQRRAPEASILAAPVIPEKDIPPFQKPENLKLLCQLYGDDMVGRIFYGTRVYPQPTYVLPVSYPNLKWDLYIEPTQNR